MIRSIDMDLFWIIFILQCIEIGWIIIKHEISIEFVKTIDIGLAIGNIAIFIIIVSYECDSKILALVAEMNLMVLMSTDYH